MPATTPAARSLAARRNAHLSWAQTADRGARTAPARRGLLAKFEAQADPTGTLPASERARRADSLRKAFYADLALKSAQARRRNAASRGGDLSGTP